LDSRIIPVFQQTVPLKSLPHWYAGTVFLGKRFLVIIAVLLVVSMLVYCFEKLKIKTKKTDLRRY